MINVSLKQMEKSIIPVSRFNKGEANKIFKELETDGVKAVFKNNQREAVIMSPSFYDNLIEMIADQLLIEEVERRLSKDTGERVSLETLMEKSGVTEEMLEAVDDSEIEFE